MWKIINPDVLEVGDVVLTTSTEISSKLIRFGTKSDISHAMLCASKMSVIDSTSDGVHARNIQKMFYDEKCSIHIMRLKVGLTSEQLSAMVNYARSVIATPYSVKEAVASVAKPKGVGSDLQFCSRLVARAYAEAGVVISENPDFCTPAMIKFSEKFIGIPDAFIGVTDDYKRKIEATGSTIDGMIAATQDLLNLARSASGNGRLNNVNDIIQFLLKNPDLDQKFSEAFIDSGYLDHWRVDVEKYAWRYSLEGVRNFLAANPGALDALIDYCMKTIESDARGDFSHWYNMFDIYRCVFLKNNLRTIRLNIRLYENLCSHHDKRVFVARSFLREIRGVV